MEPMNRNKLSDLTIGRLPAYLNYLSNARKSGQTHSSATAMAMVLGVHMTQIRRDLAMTGVTGKPKIGHPIDETIALIRNFLGWDKKRDAFLVGAGNLGSALAGYADLSATNVSIVALFDDNPQKIGSFVNGIPVFDITEISFVANRLQPEIGIITTPREAAQTSCDRLKNCGIRAIWNFTAATLETEPDVIIENVSIASSLAVLTRKILMQGHSRNIVDHATENRLSNTDALI